jgi:hypothetical protein
MLRIALPLRRPRGAVALGSLDTPSLIDRETCSSMRRLLLTLVTILLPSTSSADDKPNVVYLLVDN